MTIATAHSYASSFSDQQKLDCLRLIRSENVGPITFHQLVDYYGSVAEALDALPMLAKRGGKKRQIKRCEIATAQAEVEAIANYGAHLVCYGDVHYPPLLMNIPDAPPVLTVLGDPARLQTEQILGLVGARNGSANACAFAKKIARELGESGYQIASGLARGIDGAAHEGSLATGTIAVIAGSIDHIYPPEHESLYHRIAEAGVVMSEAPFGTSPQARHFPARNRIIAGMSEGLIVVEASPRSGSLITANDALDYGRDVFAVPGSPMDPRSAGCNQLIRQGATLITSAADVIEHLNQPPSLLAEIDAPAFEAAPRTVPDETTRDDLRVLLLEKLSPEPVLLDELLAQCHTTAHLLHAVLLELELAGRLARHPGGRVSLRIEME